MSLTINLTASEEARLSEAANRTGLAPAAYVEKMVREKLPAEAGDKKAAVMEKLRQWQSQDNTSLRPEVPTADLFARWAEEDAKLTDEEREADDRFWEEFMAGINQTRSDLGMRLL
jgi:hypothetical protein